MFFSVDILCRKGKFAIIWLAATKGKKLKRREVEGVSIEKTCNDLMSHLPAGGNGVSRKSKKQFSLYLASQLMYGTIWIFDMQHQYLLGDLKSIIDNIKRLLTVGTNIDLENPFGRNIDMADPLQDLDPVFLEHFGRPGRLMESPVIMDYGDREFFEVRTARSDRSSSSAAEPFRHLARPSDITLQEDAWDIRSPNLGMEENFPPVDGDLYPPDVAMESIQEMLNSLTQPRESPLPPAVTTEAAVINGASPMQETHYPMDEEPMAPPPAAPERPAAATPDEGDVTRQRSPEPRPPLYRREPPIAFELEPIEPEAIPTPRRRAAARRQYARTDRNCVIPGEEMNRQIQDLNANNRAQVPVVVIKRPQDRNWMERPGMGFLGAGIMPLFENNLATRREPGEFADIFNSPPWTIPIDPMIMASPIDIRRQTPAIPEEEALIMDMAVAPPQEQFEFDVPPPEPEVSAAEMARQREEEDRRKRTMESIGRTADGIAVEGGTGTGITLANITEGPLEEMAPPPEEEPAAKRPRVRSPPPRDHLAECYPPLPDMPNGIPQTFALQRDHLENTVNEMTSGGRVITFEQLCPASTATKAQAAKTFYMMLELCRGRKIAMKQEEPFGTITISRRR